MLRSAPPDHRTRPDRERLSDHAENGLHTMKTVLVVTLED
ncbi:hypothetical protein QFZ32_000220 [Streptomyces canus]|nr:hypothetical protein [Streptomyces canus]